MSSLTPEESKRKLLAMKAQREYEAKMNNSKSIDNTNKKIVLTDEEWDAIDISNVGGTEENPNSDYKPNNKPRFSQIEVKNAFLKENTLYRIDSTLYQYNEEIKAYTEVTREYLKGLVLSFMERNDINKPYSVICQIVGMIESELLLKEPFKLTCKDGFYLKGMACIDNKIQKSEYSFNNFASLDVTIRYDNKNQGVYIHDLMEQLSQTNNNCSPNCAKKLAVYNKFMWDTFYIGSEIETYKLINDVEMQLLDLCRYDSYKKQQSLIFFGSGGNGKSVLANLVASMWGVFSKSMTIEQLTNPSMRYLSKINHKKLIICHETNLESVLNTPDRQAIFNSLISCDNLELLKGTKSETLDNKARFLLLVNDVGSLEALNKSVIRRLPFVIPFKNTVPSDLQDVNMLDKLIAIKDLIFNYWLYQRMARDTLESQEIIKKQDFGIFKECAKTSILECDILTEFLKQHTEITDNPMEYVAKQKLHGYYLKFCKDNGLKPMTNVALSRKMKDRGYTERRSTKGVRSWVGLSLIEYEHNSIDNK